MATGVVLLGFGEPRTPDPELVTAYLERIFLANAEIEGDRDPEKRARELAERRAPSLEEEYEAIGGSPLNEQLGRHADRLDEVLTERGFDVFTAVGFQYTEPFIGDAVAAAVDREPDRLVGLPVYPLCGASTTVAALEEFRDALDAVPEPPRTHEVTGWHPHPTYNRVRADAIRGLVEDRGLDLRDESTMLVFSAHGTPQHYIDEGSRYARYVESYCESIAGLLGVSEFRLGYQNHENRDVPWTEPTVESVIEEVTADTVVVDPVSFMHEQSETLVELDRDLRADAAARGLDFHRVPVPHDDERFAGVLADLVEPFAAGFDPGYYNLQGCLCRDTPAAVCLNAARNRNAG